MATITGTANTPLALYTALISFLKNASLQGSQVWSQAWVAPPGAPNLTDEVLAAPGLSASQQIYVGFRLNQDVLNNRYSLDITGMTGIISAATQFNQHVNCCPDAKRLFLINQPMQYWFSASGRRVLITVKVSTVYQSAYAGFILPYSLPNNYGYPLFIGAMAGTLGANIPLSHTDVTDAHRFYPYGARNNLPEHSSPAAILDPMGQWLSVTGFRSNSAIVGNVGTLPYDAFDSSRLNRSSENISSNEQYPYLGVAQRITRNFDNDHNLIPITLVQSLPADQSYGILDGVFFAPGNLQTAENTISVSGVPHLVVPNAFRSGQLDFLAMRLA